MTKTRAGISTKRNEHGLTERQEAFVNAYVENGGNATQAAITAGYAKTAAHVRGSEALKAPAVQARMDKLVRQKMQHAAPLAVETLKELAVSASSETVRQAAASSLLDRTGYKVPVQVEVTDTRTASQVDAELAALLGLADALPVDPGAPDAPVGPEDGQELH